jgi:hypothetical protein
VLAEMTMIAEGVQTTRAAHALAQRAGIEMPIVAEVHAVLFEGRTAAEALENLMTARTEAGAVAMTMPQFPWEADASEADASELGG